MKAQVNPDECTGCELCVDTCSEVFEMEGDIAIAREGEVPSEAEESWKNLAGRHLRNAQLKQSR